MDLDRLTDRHLDRTGQVFGAASDRGGPRPPRPGGPLDLADRLQPLQAGLRRRLRQGALLTQIVRAVNSSLDPERVGEQIVAQVSDWLPLSAWLVVAVDQAGQSRTLGSDGLTPDLEEVAHLVGLVVTRTRSVFTTADLASDERVPHVTGWSHQRAAVSFPLECRGRTMGAIVGLDRDRSSRAPEFSPATVAALLSALEPGAVALDNALRVQRAEALSVTDDLTQLYNSRYLAQALRRETKRAARCGRPLSLLFVDLDGFKAVNDAHGHLAGSRALVEAAAVIKSSARETDMVARFGGDEFCVVLPDTGSGGAVTVADRVRQRVAGHPFLGAEGLTIGLTGSVGIATFPDAADSAAAMIQAADDAMYRVKGRGKNGIDVAV